MYLRTFGPTVERDPDNKNIYHSYVDLDCPQTTGNTVFSWDRGLRAAAAMNNKMLDFLDDEGYILPYYLFLNDSKNVNGHTRFNET